MCHAFTLEEKPQDVVRKMISDIKNHGKFLTEIEVLFKGRLKIKCFEVTSDMKLTNGYYKQMESDLLRMVSNVLEPIVNFTGFTTKVIVQVQNNGALDFNDINVSLHTDMPEKITAPRLFEKRVNHIFPFLEFLQGVEVKGHHHRLIALHANINLSIEDIDYVIFEEKIFPPRVTTQWMLTLERMILESEKEYAYHAFIPCFDGELLWERKEQVLRYTFQ